MLQAILTIVTLGGTALCARYFFKIQYVKQAELQMQTVVSVLSRQAWQVPDGARSRWCAARAQETHYRIAWIAPSGAMICDSEGPASFLRNSEVEESLLNAARSGDFPIVRTRDAIYTAAAVPLEGSEKSYLIGTASLDSVRETLHGFDVGLFVVLIFAGIGLCAFSVISSRRLVVPLGQLILKARESANSEGTGMEGPLGLDGADVGEWVELESALNRIQSDLRQKTETLSREREQLSTLMGAISDAILAIDGSEKPLFFNSRFALLFFDQEQRERQPHLGEIFRAPEVLQAFRKALSEGGSQNANVPLYIRSETAPHYFSLSVAPLRRDLGPVYGAVGVFHDVTELKRAENIRIDFVANVSHELRTPLTSIKGYTDTLREDVEKNRFDSAKAFLDVISRNVDRLMSLIGDLLDLSSLESSEANGKLSRSLVDTEELTSRVVAQLEGRWSQKKHQVEAHYGAAKVFADSARLEQVIVNLLENAIKYIPDGGKITITWEAAKDSVLLRIRDNGPGIPAEYHSRLFERFYRVDKGRSRDMGGTGLGLAIVKHIMQRHGGSVSVNSEPGQGTEFVCVFPSQ
ncbi:MAG: ATP-binding protein [Oligoflexia bacterium]|nr:ATP-binding protein [Oligoflexia bacterium]